MRRTSLAAHGNRRVRITAVGVFALAVSVLSGGGVVGAAAPASAAEAQMTAVGSAPPVPPGSQALGPVSGSVPLSFDVVLKPRNPQALTAYATEVSTPGSADFHQFLTPAAFASTFGPTPQTIAEVTAELRATGLNVGLPTPDGLILPVTSSAQQTSASLKTGFETYLLPTGRVAEANTSAPQIPAPAASSVQAIVGLNDLLSAPSGPPKASGSPAGPTNSVSAASTTGPQACAAAANEAKTSGGWTDTQLADAYSLKGLYSAGRLGAGTTIALFELDQYAASDIASFQSCFKTDVPITKVSVDGGDGSGSGEGEATLDIETAIGLAPQSKLLVYDAPQNTYAKSSLDEFTKIVDDDKAQIMSVSYGQCEQDLKLNSPGLQASENVVFQQAAVEGMSVFVASGDTGAEACYPNGGALEVSAGSHPSAVGTDSTTGTSYVANSGSGTVTVVSDAGLKVIGTVSLGSTTDPGAVAVDQKTDRIFVTEPGVGKMAEINGATCNAANKTKCSTAPPTIVAAPTVSQPNGVAVNPTTSTVYATEEFNDEVAVIKESPFSVVAVTPSNGSLPIGIAVDSTKNKIYVANSSLLSDSLAQINGATCDSTNVTGCSETPPAAPTGAGPRSVVVDPAASKVLVANEFGNSLSVLSTSTGATLATVSLDGEGLGADSVALSPSGSQALVVLPDAGEVGLPGVAVVNLTSEKVTGIIQKGSGTAPVAVSTDTTNGYAIVADSSGGVVFVPLFAAILDGGAQPFVTAVGGTDLKALGPAPKETTWDEAVNANCDCQEGAGTGGISTTFAMPPWQEGPGVISSLSSGSPCKASTGDCREVPDVSASADPVNGYVIFDKGAWTSIGGTSAATPLWSAMMADIESGQSPAPRLGFLDPSLYTFADEGHHDFNDVTTGTDDYLGTTNGLFPATAHYDMATGLGSPIATALATDLLGTPIVTSISPTTGTTKGGTTVTITGDNFTGATAVHFGAKAAKSFKIVSSREITAVSPAQSGSKSVTVTTAKGTSPVTPPATFVYN